MSGQLAAEANVDDGAEDLRDESVARLTLDLLRRTLEGVADHGLPRHAEFLRAGHRFATLLAASLPTRLDTSTPTRSAVIGFAAHAVVADRSSASDLVRALGRLLHRHHPCRLLGRERLEQHVLDLQRGERARAARATRAAIRLVDPARAPSELGRASALTGSSRTTRGSRRIDEMNSV